MFLHEAIGLWASRGNATTIGVPLNFGGGAVLGGFGPQPGHFSESISPPLRFSLLFGTGLWESPKVPTKHAVWCGQLIGNTPKMFKCVPHVIVRVCMYMYMSVMCL